MIVKGENKPNRKLTTQSQRTTTVCKMQRLSIKKTLYERKKKLTVYGAIVTGKPNKPEKIQKSRRRNATQE